MPGTHALFGGILALWATSPVLKKAILFTIEPPVYTVAHTTLGTIVAWTVFGTQVHALPTPTIGLLLLGSVVSVATNMLLATLLKRETNPGEVMALLNAGSTVVTYLAGALLFGEVHAMKTAGVILISGGILLVTNSDT